MFSTQKENAAEIPLTLCTCGEYRLCQRERERGVGGGQKLKIPFVPSKRRDSLNFTLFSFVREKEEGSGTC